MHFIYHSSAVCAMIWIIWYTFSFNNIDDTHRHEWSLVPVVFLPQLKDEIGNSNSNKVSMQALLTIETEYYKQLQSCLLNLTQPYLNPSYYSIDSSYKEDNKVLTIKIDLYHCISRNNL